jgi:hypothetical protein
MAAGALGLILTLTVFSSRRRTTVVDQPPAYPAAGTTQRVVEERSPYDVDRPL